MVRYSPIIRNIYLLWTPTPSYILIHSYQPFLWSSILVTWKPFFLNPSIPPEGVPLKKYLENVYGKSRSEVSSKHLKDMGKYIPSTEIYSLSFYCFKWERLHANVSKVLIIFFFFLFFWFLFFSYWLLYSLDLLATLKERNAVFILGRIGILSSPFNPIDW